MNRLSNTGKKVARRCFAAFMAVLLCTTVLGTNFGGSGLHDSPAIATGFDVFAADTVAYGPGQTYYDAGTLKMNAYYDSSTGNKLAESSANYHATDWDVTAASSYVAGAVQNGNKGVTILSTTDIADAGKHGSASDMAAGGDGRRGIMCFSEYLNALNGKSHPGDDDYSAYEKSVPDYEAPAGVDTVTYQYIARGETGTADNGQVEIKWTVFAWPADQNLEGQSEADRRALLDTPGEIEAEWDRIGVTEIPGNNGTRLDVPGEIVSAAGVFQNAGMTGAKDSASLFYNGQPEWLSGNRGAFDSWITDGEEHYLMNMGLWSRLETSPVKVESVRDGGSLTLKGTPSVSFALYKPSNSSEVYTGADVKFTLTESLDTNNLPLYAYLAGYSDEDNLMNMVMSDIIKGQTSQKTASIPTYNIRRQLYAAWNTTQAEYLRKAISLTCRRGIPSADPANNTEVMTRTGLNVTGVRLYAVASYPRIDIEYVNTNSDYLNNGTEPGTIGTVVHDPADQWVSAVQNGTDYGSSAGDNPVMFVFNENDINPSADIVHINNIPGNVFNLVDIYSGYDTSLKHTAGSDLVADDVPNTLVPMSVRSDAYYDVTEDYQRAAGVLYGRVDASTIDTSAVNAVTGGKIARPSVDDRIIDTVSYTGLNSGTKYVLEGRLYNADGTPVGDAVRKEFIPSVSAGSTTVEFVFDSSGFSNNTKIVVTEVLKTSDGIEVARHDDLTDADQTVVYSTDPILSTRASLAGGGKTITDEVTYLNFKPDTEYVLTTKAWDKNTGSYLDPIVTTEFMTDGSGAGTVTVEFSGYDAVALSNHTVVMHEYAAEKGTPDTVAARHEDNDDELQTVVISADVKIVTSASSGTGSKYLDAVDAETIVDDVTVTGLSANTAYTARATLYDVTAGQTVTGPSNEVLSWTCAFMTDADGEGRAEVAIGNFSASDRAGHTLVVYEDIIDSSGIVIATHADNADADQTVTVKTAGIMTVLTDRDGNKTMASSASMNFKDAISYSGLVPGNRYYMVSTLVDKATGKVLMDSSGSQAVVTSTVFRANSTGTNAGGSTFTFTNMASSMTGKTVVAYNDLYRVLDDTPAESSVTDSTKAELVASEHDLANADQTVVIDAVIEITDPVIDTVAKGVDGSKDIPLATNSVIKDDVSYSGLIAGRTYTLTADVYDTSTGKRAAGYTKEQTMDFTAGDGGKGTAVMTIDINTMELAGHKLVVYETLSLGDTTIASHRDLTDADQTVTVNNEFQASLDTVAVDKATGGKTLMASSDAAILDRVYYDGLDTSLSYTLTTTVYDKATGKLCSDIKAVETTFTPSESSGHIEVTIPVDGTKYTAGQSLVVYEELTSTSRTNESNGNNTSEKTVTVASHKDISDADQTVTFVRMSTYLTGDGTSAKAVHVGSDAYVIDTASFTGLTPNRTYVITTQLMDVAASSGAITLDTDTASSQASGSAVASRTMEFTPTTANGSIATQINVNTTGLQGHSLVAVATVKDKETGQTVATHIDTANVDQTITVQTRVEAQTGVGTASWFFGMIAVILLSAFISYEIGLYSDRRNNRI